MTGPRFTPLCILCLILLGSGLCSNIVAQYSLDTTAHGNDTNRVWVIVKKNTLGKMNIIARLDTVVQFRKNSSIGIFRNRFFIVDCLNLPSGSRYINFSVWDISIEGLTETESYYEKFQVRGGYLKNLSFSIEGVRLIANVVKTGHGWLGQKLYFDLDNYEPDEFKYFMKLVRRMVRQKVPKKLQEISQETIWEQL
jgi:hypothetical protein